MAPEKGEKNPDGRQGAPEGDKGGDRREAPGPPEARGVACDLCGAPMLERHCKLICIRCGYQRDCSDP